MQIDFSGPGVFVFGMEYLYMCGVCAEYVLCMYECVCRYCKLRQLNAPHEARYLCEAISKRSARYFLFSWSSNLVKCVCVYVQYSTSLWVEQVFTRICITCNCTLHTIHTNTYQTPHVRVDTCIEDIKLVVTDNIHTYIHKIIINNSSNPETEWTSRFAPKFRLMGFVRKGI